MEALVRYPENTLTRDRQSEDLELVKLRESRLRVTLTLLLSVNLALACGAATLGALLLKEMLFR